jgi:hypothetical protein
VAQGWEGGIINGGARVGGGIINGGARVGKGIINGGARVGGGIINSGTSEALWNVCRSRADDAALKFDQTPHFQLEFMVCCGTFGGDFLEC